MSSFTPIKNASFLLLALGAVCSCGCVSHRLTLERAAEYLAQCPQGYPVASIERDLRLPAPSKTEAPASDSPHWKYQYFCDGLWIYFEVEEYQGKDGGEERAFWCTPDVETLVERWEAIGRILSESSTPKTKLKPTELTFQKQPPILPKYPLSPLPGYETERQYLTCDLNEDGHPEYFLVDLTGVHSAAFAVIDSKGNSLLRNGQNTIGSYDRLLILTTKHNGYSDLIGSNRDCAVVNSDRWAFNGKRYERVAWFVQPNDAAPDYYELRALWYGWVPLKRSLPQS